MNVEARLRDLAFLFLEVCVHARARASFRNRGRNVFIWWWSVRRGVIVKGELLNLEETLTPLVPKSGFARAP